MFNKKEFAIIIEKIKNSYSNQEEFSKISGIGRTYLSQYMNQKKDKPPTPRILKMLASASKGITTYEDLMYMCGHTNTRPFGYGIVSRSIAVLPLFISLEGNLLKDTDLYVNKSVLKQGFEYFAYRTKEDSMAPLLNIDDIAIIEKQINNTFENGKTYLLKFEDKILIRKIIDTENSVELHAMNPYYPIIKTTKENIEIIGRVIKAENQSAFK